MKATQAQLLIVLVATLVLGAAAIMFVNNGGTPTPTPPTSPGTTTPTPPVSGGGGGGGGGGGCVVGGCSSQLCTDEADGPAISDCMYRAEYACYRTATCERQANGACGWTPSPALSACLQNPPPIE